MKLVAALYLVGLIYCIRSVSGSLSQNYHDAVGFEMSARIKAAEETGTSNELKSRMAGWYPKLGEYPFVAGMLVTLVDDSESVCGATMVSRFRLLTAASCWWDGTYQTANFEIVLGSAELQRGGYRAVVEEDAIRIHSKYDHANHWNDICMMILDKYTDLELTPFIQPIVIPAVGEIRVKTFNKDRAFALGFGKNTPYVGPVEHGDRILKSGSLKVITNSECAEAYKDKKIIDSMLCATADEHVGPCDGDTGSPLVVTLPLPLNTSILIGITSFGHLGDCQTGRPVGFTRINAFIEWIKALT